jgi:hypothetical protein
MLRRNYNQIHEIAGLFAKKFIEKSQLYTELVLEPLMALLYATGCSVITDQICRSHMSWN